MTSVPNSVRLAGINCRVQIHEDWKALVDAETGQILYTMYDVSMDEVTPKKVQVLNRAEWNAIANFFANQRRDAIYSKLFSMMVSEKKEKYAFGRSRFHLSPNVSLFQELNRALPTERLILRIKGSLKVARDQPTLLCSPSSNVSDYNFDSEIFGTKVTFDVNIPCSEAAVAENPLFFFETSNAMGMDDPITKAWKSNLGLRSDLRMHLECLVSLEWRKPMTGPITLDSNSILAGLFSDHATKDFSVIAGNGVPVKCHGAILSGQSEVFSRMINPSNKMKESLTKTIKMEYLNENCVNLLVNYLYGLPLPTHSLNCHDMLPLLQAANMYELSHLNLSLQEIILQKNINWFTPCDSLELYFFVRNLPSSKKVRNHLLDVLNSISAPLRKCKKFLDLNKEETSDLIWKLYDRR